MFLVALACILCSKAVNTGNSHTVEQNTANIHKAISLKKKIKSKRVIAESQKTDTPPQNYGEVRTTGENCY